MPAQNGDRKWLADWLSNLFLRALITLLLVLPYRARVPAMGWLSRKIIAPLVGYNRRSRANLELIFPDMPGPERDRIAAGAADNMGRTIIEGYSPRELGRICAAEELRGPGLHDIERARANGQPVILVSGHFGNHEAPRAALAQRGYTVGILYRAASNRYFERHYQRTLAAVGGPVFVQGRRGTGGFVRYLRAGGMLALFFDQHVNHGKKLPFLGQPARTALSAAKLALRYDALLIPYYARRRADGLHFEITYEAPVPHSDPETMTRAMNASLQARILAHPEQWLWMHRRWKTVQK